MHPKQRTTKSYSITSPYMELLESNKRKVYGLKYHSSISGNASHSKSNHNQNTTNLNTSSVKGRPASSSLASHHNKSGIKSNSSQKVKSTKTHNAKKKRIYTQQAQNFNETSSDPKMHESLFVNMDKNQINQLTGKPLFSNQNPIIQKNNYINNFDFLKKFSEFNAQLKEKQHVNFSGSKSQKSNKSAKSKGKKFNKNNHNRSINFESINVGKSIEQLGLTEIDDMICLIDNCVEQANQYISFLASKVESLKSELMKCKTEEFQLQRIIKQKNHELEIKDSQILKLKKQIQTLKSQKVISQLSSLSNVNSSSSVNANEEYKNKEMKKILEVLNQMNEQNQFLQSKVKNLQMDLSSKLLQPSNKKKFQYSRYASQDRDYQQEQWINGSLQMKSKGTKQRRKSSNGKQIYNEIHSKIDILNISIDNNKKTTQNNNYSSSSNQDQKSQSKKYKFIKPKNK